MEQQCSRCLVSVGRTRPRQRARDRDRGGNNDGTPAATAVATAAATSAAAATAPPASGQDPGVPSSISDKSNLRPDAKQIVAQAAQSAKNGNKTVIHVTGHTDTSGSAEYNMGLSKRRAMSVKAELIRLGIPAREIDVQWKGKSEPLVQTGDGVKEPQNRRVEIVYE